MRRLENGNLHRHIWDAKAKPDVPAFPHPKSNASDQLVLQ
jgi:hypothetical protein